MNSLEVNNEHHHAELLGLLLCSSIFLLTAIYLSIGSSIIWDEKFVEWFSALRNENWTGLWKAIAILGESTVIIAITVVLTAIVAVAAGILKALWIPAGVAVSYILNLLLKSWFARPRPEMAWGIEVEGYSFPSGNAMLAATLYGLFAVWLWRYGKISITAKKVSAIISVLLMILIVCSRLYFGVHYFSDIVVGVACGGFVLFSAMLLAKRIITK